MLQKIRPWLTGRINPRQSLWVKLNQEIQGVENLLEGFRKLVEEVERTPDEQGGYSIAYQSIVEGVMWSTGYHKTPEDVQIALEDRLQGLKNRRTATNEKYN